VGYTNSAQMRQRSAFAGESSLRTPHAAAHVQTDHSEGTLTAASHPTSHTLLGDNQADNGPRQSDPPSLTVTRVGVGGSGYRRLHIRTAAARAGQPWMKSTMSGMTVSGSSNASMCPAAGNSTNRVVEGGKDAASSRASSIVTMGSRTLRRVQKLGSWSESGVGS
jgi:hypothetical protein